MNPSPPPVRGVLNVYAHPDDESYGDPGTISLYAGRGVSMSLVCFTRGEAGETNGVCPPGELGEVRAAELRAACGVLGISRLEQWDYPDGGLNGVDAEEAIARLMEAFEDISPEVVVTHSDDGVTGHPDHLAVSAWATEAFHRSRAGGMRPGGSASAPSRLYWRVIPAHRREALARPDLIYRDDYTTIIDARSRAGVRRRAEACHATQRPHTDYDDPSFSRWAPWTTTSGNFPNGRAGLRRPACSGGKLTRRDRFFRRRSGRSRSRSRPPNRAGESS